jgi:hypothetical protein
LSEGQESQQLSLTSTDGYQLGQEKKWKKKEGEGRGEGEERMVEGPVTSPLNETSCNL